MIVAIIAFLLGRRLVASGLVVILVALGAFAIALAILSWFKKQKLAYADSTELSQKLVEQETRNQTLEQSLLQVRQKLVEQEQHNQTLEQLLAQVNQQLAEQERHIQTLEQSLSQSGQKSAEPEQLSELEQPRQMLEQPPFQSGQKLTESEQHAESEQPRQALEQYQRDLDDAQVGLRDALMVLVSYQMAIQPIPGNYRGDYFVEKVSIDRINQMSTRSFSRWLRVIQNEDNRHSKDIREMLDGQETSTIDLPTLETVMHKLISSGEAESL